MNYILYGEQYPMIQKRLNKILKERLGEPDDFNVIKFDISECNPQEVIDEINYLPLGYDKKVVVVDKCTFLASNGPKELKEIFTDVIKENNESVDIILIHHSGTIDEKSEIFKSIKENGQIFNFVNLKKEDWPIYIRKYFKDHNVTIDAAAVSELAERVDGDLYRFHNEAEKLCLYKDSLALVDITLMVAKPIEDDVFQLSNALIRGDNSTALEIFRGLQLLGSRATDTLIPMLASNFRFASQALYLSGTGLSNGQIASQLGSSEARVGVTLRNYRRFSKALVDRILDDLYRLDYQIKSGLIDRFYGFELFLINFPN